jgi:hypothetical protein
MATAADWMSAASFISLAGLIAFKGYDASAYLMGWTGGYVLLALLLAPLSKKIWKIYGPRVYWGSILFENSSNHRCDLFDRRVNNLRYWADEGGSVSRFRGSWMWVTIPGSWWAC